MGLRFRLAACIAVWIRENFFLFVPFLKIVQKSNCPMAFTLGFPENCKFEVNNTAQAQISGVKVHH